MIKKLYIGLVACLVSFGNLFAQQDMMLTQEIFSRVNVNPAGIGNSNELDVFLHGRFQWAGVDNAPRTIVMNAMDYEEKLKSGFGLSVVYDKFGVGHSNTNIKIPYSYQLDLNEKTILSLGLAAGVNFGYFNFDENVVEENVQYESELFAKEKNTKVKSDFDFGVELSQLHWTFGASVTHLLNNEAETQVFPRHLYLYGIGLVSISPKWNLSPTLCYIHRHQSNVLEVGCLGYYQQFLWGGFAWRPDVVESFGQSTLAITVGADWKYFRLGYSFDLGLGSLAGTFTNTHELILSFHMPKGKKK